MSHLFRKLTFAFLTVMCVFSAAQAYYTDDFIAFDDCCKSNSFSFGLEAKGLYLLPSGCNLDYAVEVDPTPVQSPDWKVYNVNPDYHGAFEVGAFVINKDTCSHLDVYWEHLYANDRHHRNTPEGSVIGPLFEIDPTFIPYRNARGRVVHHFDEVNLHYGAFVQFCNCLNANFFAGVSGVRIKQHHSTRFSDLSGLTNRHIRNPASYYGAGPQLGLDISYNFTNCIQLNAEGSASLFVGRVKNHSRFVSNFPPIPGSALVPPNEQRVRVDRKMCVVPAFKGKLGLAFTTSYCNWLFSLEAGYQVQVYVNAIHRVSVSTQTTTPPTPVPGAFAGVFARTFHKTISNFALSGPYLALNVAF